MDILYFFADVLARAEDGFGNDAGGHRAEFLELVRRAREFGDGR